MSQVPPTSSPPAGWYPDPAEPSVIRWWDGAQWTHHLQPAPHAADPVPAGPPWLTTRNVSIALLAMLALLAVGFVLISGTSDDPSAATVADDATPAELETLDAEAKTQAHTAQVAIETYSTNHNGGYAGATTADLQEIEPALTGPITVEGQSEGYALTAESESGNSFMISRDSTGVVTYSCNTAGVAGCPEGGDWSAEIAP